MLPIAAPLLALAQDPDAGLPVCCRRHGAHHCTMLTKQHRETNSAPGIGAVCPRFPNHSIATTTRVASLVASAASVTASLKFEVDSVRHAEGSHRHESANAHPKRGPPVALL